MEPNDTGAPEESEAEEGADGGDGSYPTNRAALRVAAASSSGPSLLSSFDGGATPSAPPPVRRKDRRKYVAVQPFEVEPVYGSEGSGREEDEDDVHSDSPNNSRTPAIVSATVAVLCVLISSAVHWTTRHIRSSPAAPTSANKSQHLPPTAEPSFAPEPIYTCDGTAAPPLDDTMRVAFDRPFAALFRDRHHQSKFEASDVVVVDNFAYAVCDSSWAVSRIDLSSMTPLSFRNVQIESGIVRPDKEESDYEAIFYHGGMFYVVRESIKFKKSDHQNNGGTEPLKGYHAVIEELSIREDGSTYDVVDACPTAFEFETDNKGLEGAVGLTEAGTGDLYILGLCEANDCKKSHQDRPGNGKIVVMKKRGSMGVGNAPCIWDTVKVLSIPSTANFHDYSAIALTSDGRVAITSQEDSKLWLGRLMGMDDISILEFDRSVGRMLSFPKSADCHITYCNVEGIFFLDDGRFLGVSDKMKGKGKQDYRCFEKDQSIHVFVLP